MPHPIDEIAEIQRRRAGRLLSDFGDAAWLQPYLHPCEGSRLAIRRIWDVAR